MFLAFTPDDALTKCVVPVADIKRVRENKGGITIEFYENPSATLETVGINDFITKLQESDLCLSLTDLQPSH